MATKTIYATMQVRQGLEENLDVSKLKIGEWALSTDSRYIRICVANGIALRMATYEAFEQDMKLIRQILLDCQTIQEAVERIQTEIGQTAEIVGTNAETAKNAADIATQKAEEATESADSAAQAEEMAVNKANEAATYALSSSSAADTATEKALEAAGSATMATEKAGEAAESAEAASTSASTAIEKTGEASINAEKAETNALKAESYAKGGTESREGEDTDNALYYKNLSAEEAIRASLEADRAKNEADRAASIADIDIAKIGKPGVVQPDGTTITVDEDGTIHAKSTGGTTTYEELTEKPSINGVELTGNKTLEDMGIQPAGEYIEEETDPSVPAWAKAENKPSYSASEVGADPEGSASQALIEANSYTEKKAEEINANIEKKLDKVGDTSNNTITFNAAEVRENIATGDKHSVIFGKIAKFLADLKAVAFSGKYSDLLEKPENISSFNNDSGYVTENTKYSLSKQGREIILSGSNGDTSSAWIDNMTGATESTAGKAGYVPAPAVGDNTKYLCGDGTWKEQTASVDTLTTMEEVEAATDPSIPVGVGAVKELSSSLTNVNVYVGEDDGKLHFVDSAGADSVLPFSGGWEEIKVVTLTSNLTIDIGRKPKEVLVGWSATNVTTKEFNLYYYYNEDFSSYGFGSLGVTINDNGVTISCKYSGRPVFYAYK